jgi:hypothetical protein
MDNNVSPDLFAFSDVNMAHVLPLEFLASDSIMKEEDEDYANPHPQDPLEPDDEAHMDEMESISIKDETFIDQDEIKMENNLDDAGSLLSVSYGLDNTMDVFVYLYVYMYVVAPFYFALDRSVVNKQLTAEVRKLKQILMGSVLSSVLGKSSLLQNKNRKGAECVQLKHRAFIEAFSF